MNKYLRYGPILIPVGTLAAYITTFVYERGLFYVYGLPSEMIVITITGVFIAFAALAVTVMAVYQIIDNMYLSDAHDRQHSLKGRIALMTFPILYGAACFVALRGIHREMALPIALIVIPGAYLFIWPFRLIHVKGYVNKLNESDARVRRSGVRQGLVETFVKEKFGFSFTRALLLTAALASLSFFAGEGRAYSRQIYVQVEGKKDYVAVIVDHDYLILKHYDPKSRSIKGDFQVVRNENLTFSTVKLEMIQIK